MFILNKQPGQPQEIFRTKKLKRQNLPYRPMYTYIYIWYTYIGSYTYVPLPITANLLFPWEILREENLRCASWFHSSQGWRCSLNFYGVMPCWDSALWQEVLLRLRKKKKTEQKRKHTVDGRESCTRRKEPSMIIYLHPGRLTRNIIMEAWKIIFLSKWVICRFHVNLPRCINWCRMSSINIIKAISWIYLPLPGCWLGKPPGWHETVFRSARESLN